MDDQVVIHDGKDKPQMVVYILNHLSGNYNINILIRKFKTFNGEGTNTIKHYDDSTTLE